MSKAIGEISTAALAYLGDSVLEVCVREMLVKKGVSSAKNLNLLPQLISVLFAQALLRGTK